MRTRPTRGTSTPMGVALLVLALFFGAGLDVFAQTPYVPYFGKNRIRYDDFKWKIYTTDHFEIFYYPEIEQHLERVASYAESAYQQVSADLKHDLAFKVPMVLYQTQSEFQQQNIEPMELPEGVLAFAEPYRNRMVLPIDEPPDQLYRLITHELTHLVFNAATDNPYHSPPVWLNEGIADYLAVGYDEGMRAQVESAARGGRVPPLDALAESRLTELPDFSLAYAQSVSAVAFFVETYGEEELWQLVRSYAAGVSDDDAFAAATGGDVAMFNAAWLDSLGQDVPQPYGPQPAPPGPIPPGWNVDPAPTPPDGAPTPASPGPTRSPGAGPSGYELGRALADVLVVLLLVAIPAVVVAVILIRRANRPPPGQWQAPGQWPPSGQAPPPGAWPPTSIACLAAGTSCRSGRVSTTRRVPIFSLSLDAVGPTVRCCHRRAEKRRNGVYCWPPKTESIRFVSPTTRPRSSMAA